ncbi:RND family efflux transporter MFP subunit [Fontibacillus phaseoli]|uniref:RND family efflux transporter MFP subunit n=1 Tax=Fontibacillus phaseoli TaxID=1416533 RepID=A0A369B3U0_9BACL|nr:efflux RND transporter periplasmic adaptor subunit [Fontibacillus phaseoli]RCX16199.1 RND family efflux transporter MFP subunit [Fontibacillus phaseoli]
MDVLKKKWIWGIIIGVVVIGLVLVNIVNTNRAAPVKTVEVAEDSIVEVIYTNGKLEPENTTEMYSPASGVVEDLKIKLGDTVTKGQILLTLKMDEMKEQLKKERLNLQLAESERLQAKKKHFDNFKKVMNEDPGQDLAEVDLTAYDLRIQSSKLIIASLEKKLTNSVVHAPVEGVVTGLTVNEGQLIAEGSSIVSISDLSSYKVRAYLNELDAGKAAMGMKAVITSESFAGTYDGEVTYLAPTAKIVDTTSKDTSVEMTVGLKTTSAELRSGYNVAIAMEIPDKPRLLVPISAVQYEGEQAFVFKPEEGRAVKVPVTTGKEGDEQIEIVSGAAKGDRIVVDGVDSLRDGDKVSVQ